MTVLLQFARWFNATPLGQFFQEQNLYFLGPEIIVLLGLLLSLVLSFAKSKKDQQSSWLIAFMATVLAALTLVTHYFSVYAAGFTSNTDVLFGMVQADFMSWVARLLMLGGTAVVLLFSKTYVERFNPHTSAEVYVLLQTALLGGLLLAGAADMVMLFVALETLGISSYVMAGLLRSSTHSAEASIKYLVYGGTASALLLFALSGLYGLSGGSTSLLALAPAFMVMPDGVMALLPYVLVLLLASIGFKLSAAPFHSWTPDVYEGAPTPITAFLAGVSKVAGFAFGCRLLVPFVTPLAFGVLQPFLVAVSIASMVWGNLQALRQTDVKRLLAFSSVGHVGYLLLAFVSFNPDTMGQLWFYVATYVAMTLGAFGCVIAVEKETGAHTMASYAGLVRKKPWVAGLMTLFLLSLAGIPPTAGFFAKFFLFQSLVAVNGMNFWLVGLALLASVVGLAYYLRLVKVMLVDEPSREVEAIPLRPGLRLQGSATALALALCAVFTLALGFLAQPLSALSTEAMGQLMRAQHPLLLSSTQQP